ncbi:uncharacterized protein [Ptychodera flava]|uniref:uncharacterized protein n=1 Tax=Ptychodera flava TaxID=63121 RepID=UPI00396A2095
MDRPVAEAKPVGNNLRSTCNICHRRGHKSTGNKNSEGCLLGEPCRGYIFCGRQDKHRHDYMARLKQLKERESQLAKQISAKETELKQLHEFQSRSASVFTSAITPRLFAAFPEKYNRRTTTGKTALLHDISILRKVYNNQAKNIPILCSPQDDRQEFERAIAEAGDRERRKDPQESCTKIYDILINTSPVRRVRESPNTDSVECDASAEKNTEADRKNRRGKCHASVRTRPCRENFDSSQTSSEDEEVGAPRARSFRKYPRRDYRDYPAYPPPFFHYGYQPPVPSVYPPPLIQVGQEHLQHLGLRNPVLTQRMPQSMPTPHSRQYPYFDLNLSPYHAGFRTDSQMGFPNRSHEMSDLCQPAVESDIQLASCHRNISVVDQSSSKPTFKNSVADVSMGTADRQQAMRDENNSVCVINTTQPAASVPFVPQDATTPNTSNMEALFEAALLLQTSKGTPTETETSS